jgi:hypothetical protein
MSIQILKDLADSLPDMDKNIKEMEELIKFSKEQGNSVVEMQGNLTRLKLQRDKLYQSLKGRGYVK